MDNSTVDTAALKYTAILLAAFTLSSFFLGCLDTIAFMAASAPGFLSSDHLALSFPAFFHVFFIGFSLISGSNVFFDIFFISFSPILSCPSLNFSVFLVFPNVGSFAFLLIAWPAFSFFNFSNFFLANFNAFFYDISAVFLICFGIIKLLDKIFINLFGIIFFIHKHYYDNYFFCE